MPEDKVFEIIEGTPIKDPNGAVNEWDFGFNTWPRPYFIKVTSKHPDNPPGFVHDHWKDYDSIRSNFVASREEAEKEGRAWTPARRRVYLTRPPVFWLALQDAFYYRGWLTPRGRRRFRRIYNKDGMPFAAMALTDADFNFGITIEMCWCLWRFRSWGDSGLQKPSAEDPEFRHKRYREVQDLISKLETTPAHMLRQFHYWRDRFLKEQTE